VVSAKKTGITNIMAMEGEMEKKQARVKGMAFATMGGQTKRVRSNIKQTPKKKRGS